MKSLRYILMSIVFFTVFLQAQSNLSLKDIYQENTFEEKNVTLQFHPDGRHFTRLIGKQIQLFDRGTGQKKEVLFDAPSNIHLQNYQLSPDGAQILIEANSEKIYRHSQRADFFVYDIEKQILTSVWEAGKQRYAGFSPDGRKVAFVFQNDLYYRDLQKGEIIRVTKDGQVNHIINGAADWVYEEEFGLTCAYAWSPDSRYLAYLRFDETEVPEVMLMNYLGGIYPEDIRWKYPKVGQSIAETTAWVFDLEKNRSREIELSDASMPYLPRIGWTPNGEVYLYRMNRPQNHFELWMADARSGSVQQILTEKDPAYIELPDNPVFLPRDEGWLWTSEKDGWNHIYHYSQRGRLIGQVTSGDWEVEKIVGFDASNNLIYYQSAEKSPLERHIYSINLDGKGKTVIGNAPGWYDVQFSPDFSLAFITHSTINSPPTYGLYTNRGNLKYWLEENQSLGALQQLNGTVPVDFWTFESKNGVKLNGWMIKPLGFQDNQKYPVLLYVYGGPGSQRVANRWNVMRDYWWLQLMAQNGYVIACVDNRGTGGRGARFKKQTFLKLGQYEMEDQIEAARYLARQPYVDAQHIGIYGKSYGGFLSTMCMFRGGEVFAAGIALAPVTNWQWYDCIYTERYMRTVDENREGYRLGAPVNYADQLTDPFFLVHGLGDDNVHFQHSAELAGALVAANKQFDIQVYPNVNHSLRGGNTAIHLYTKMTDFLDQHLRRVNTNAEEDRLLLTPTMMTTPKDKSDYYLKLKKIPDKMKIKNN